MRPPGLLFPTFIFAAVFLIGLINAINPRLMWTYFEKWKAKEEPSKAYFMVQRLMGIVAMVIIAWFVLYPRLMGMGF